MRLLGYLLLLLGFTNMTIVHYARIHDIKGRAQAQAIPSHSENRTFGVNEVSKIVQHALDEMEASYPKFLFFVTIMLAGAILLDIANNRRKGEKDTAQPGAAAPMRVVK